MAARKGRNAIKGRLLGGDGVPAAVARRMLRRLCDELGRLHGVRRRRDRSMAAGDLLAWGQRYLAEHFSRPPSRMHRYLAAQLDAMDNTRGMKLAVMGPRGGAKSTLATLAYVLRAAIEAREPYIWIVSDTRHQATAHLENVKSELADNARLAADYPAAAGRGPVWRKASITLPNSVTVEAYGTGQRIRGRRHRAHRPTLIVCDDLENDSHMRSAAARQRSRDWFHGTLLKAGTRRTNVVHLATALHREALAMRLASTAGWTARTFRAIERWPREMSLWQEWERIYTDLENPGYRQAALEFYRRHQAQMDQGAVLLWPEEEDLYTLMALRAESGHTAFEREKQNSPINPQMCEWPEDYFDERIWFDAWPEALAVKTLALDPSKGSDARRGDYSAYVMLGVDRRGMLYVEADMARLPVPDIVSRGAELYGRFQPDGFGVEANQFQDLLAAAFATEFHRRGLLGVRPWLLNNQVSKQVRIRRLGPHLAARRMRFRASSAATRLLVEQLQEFPIADHDDGPDALEMALRMAGELVRPSRTDNLGTRLPISLA